MDTASFVGNTAFFHNNYSEPGDFARIITADPPFQLPVPSPVLGCPDSSWRAVACSAGGGGGRKPPKTSGRNPHTSLAAASDCQTTAMYELRPPRSCQATADAPTQFCNQISSWHLRKPRAAGSGNLLAPPRRVENLAVDHHGIARQVLV